MTVPGDTWGRVMPAHRGPTVRRRSRLEGVPGQGPWLSWGNGRSYGDVACNRDGTLIEARGADRILEIDRGNGVLRCESGALLGALQARVMPLGWFLPVVPGTELVTVGGAVANDVHGKNHHRAGSIGHHVRALELVRSTGERFTCGPELRPQWFQATVGGLGLTGLISWVELRLRAVSAGGWLWSRARREPDLAALLERLQVWDERHEYTAAWFDCLAGTQSRGRGVVSAADHAGSSAGGKLPRSRHRTVPVTPPLSPVRPAAVRLFNAWYFYRHPRRERPGVQWYRTVLHPLDHLTDWNRLYGPGGFLQCQIVIPEKDHREVLTALLERIKARGEGSVLAVLKRFGDIAPVGHLSFPRAGYTLALDFPRRGAATDGLVRTIYELALEAGGAIYPAKDAVMSAEQFLRSYPRAGELMSWRDPAVASDFARRVGLV